MIRDGRRRRCGPLEAQGLQGPAAADWSCRRGMSGLLLLRILDGQHLTQQVDNSQA